MAQVLAEQFFAQLVCIGEVAVVSQRQAIGRIYVERLRFSGGIAACGRVAHMADTHAALEGDHVARMKHVTHKAIVLAQVNAFSVAGDDAGCVLAAVL